MEVSPSTSTISSISDSLRSNCTETAFECREVVENYHRTLPIPFDIFPESTATTNIRHIALTECNQVTFGNQNFYQGPITIVCDTQDELKTVIDSKKHASANSTKERRSTFRQQFDRIWQTRKRKILFLVFFGGIASALIVITAVMLQISIVNDTIAFASTNMHGTLKIIKRNEWKARSPSEPSTYLQLPVHRVVFEQTATPNCSTQVSELHRSAKTELNIFRLDENNFGDIGYNFLVGGDGNVYEGCGWNRQVANARRYKQDIICIALIGTFPEQSPSKQQVMAAEKLIEKGIALRKIVTDYRLFGLRQLIAYESPSLERYIRCPHSLQVSSQIDCEQIEVDLPLDCVCI